MGYDFYLYEQKGDYKKITLEEVLYFGNSRAMIVAMWLDRNFEPLFERLDFNLHYIEISSDYLKYMKNDLEAVLNEKDPKIRDLKALHYFPVRYTIGSWCSSVEMWSDSYYYDLESIYEALSRLKILDDDYDDGMLYDYNYMFKFAR